jgi:hypothetical protein
MPNSSDSMRQMISLNYDAGSRRVERQASEIVVAKQLGGWCQAEEPERDRRLVFSADCAEAFDIPSKYGVDRNVR